MSHRQSPLFTLKTPTSRPVSFRLSGEHYALLEKEALAGKRPPGIIARDRLIAALAHGSEAAALSDRLEDLEETVKAICHDLPLIAEALLLAATSGQKLLPSDAARWVAENLITKGQITCSKST